MPYFDGSGSKGATASIDDSLILNEGGEGRRIHGDPLVQSLRAMVSDRMWAADAAHGTLTNEYGLRTIYTDITEVDTEGEAFAAKV
jgi:hypothetical protein